jgi:AAA15 family ATPase/GTPase
MKTTTRLIKEIEIHRFRSLDGARIQTKTVNIFSGKNNSGKSNVLRALNLFFNSETRHDSPFRFDQDYNRAFTKSATGKRQITIKIIFFGCGNGALKSDFSITRVFSLGATSAEVIYESSDKAVQDKIDKKDGNTMRQFTMFLNKISYFYIPAVRDKSFVKHLLLNFESIIKNDAQSKEFGDSIGTLSKIIMAKSDGISKSFESFIGLKTFASLSSNVEDILGALEIYLEPGLETKKNRRNAAPTREQINLFSSGDGILMSYIAYFLEYVCKISKNTYFVWGFEEPENSLEYSKVQKLAEDFSTRFSKIAQLFITTHSPAFIKLGNTNEDNIMLFRVYVEPQRKDDVGRVPYKQISSVRTIEQIHKRQQSLFNNDNYSDEYIALSDELHMVEFANEIEAAVAKVEEEKKRLEEENALLKQKMKTNKLNIISEGKNHKHIKKAIEMLDNNMLTNIHFVTGLEDKTSDDQLIKLFGYEVCNPSNRILFVWDCDAENKVSALQEKNNTFKFVLPKNESSAIQKGIENIYPNNIIPNDIYDDATGDYGESRQTFSDNGKNKIMNVILQSADVAIFSGYKTLLDKVSKIVSNN